MTPFQFATTPRIVCETDSSLKLADFLADTAINRPFIVTDPGLVKSGILQPALEALNERGVAFTLYQEVQADPPEQVILDSLAQAQQSGCDGVVGFGGGSAMDTAKLVALLLDGKQQLSEIYGVGNAKGKRLPLIQIPTTAGTGSEVTPIAIVTTGATTKTGVVAPQLLPDIAILDARLTVGLPAAITAATGIDAMVHAIEAFTSKHRKNPLSDMLAKEALRLLNANLHEAVHNGSNLAARQNMLLGACLAGQAFANAPVAAVHALAYPLGGIYHIPHGLSNALVLAEVLRFNATVAAPLYAELAQVLGLDDSGNNQQAAAAFVHWAEQLSPNSGLPTRLRDLDIPQDAISQLAADAMLQQRLLINNPREVTEQDAFAIYSKVW